MFFYRLLYAHVWPHGKYLLRKKAMLDWKLPEIVTTCETCMGLCSLSSDYRMSVPGVPAISKDNLKCCAACNEVLTECVKVLGD